MRFFIASGVNRKLSDRISVTVSEPQCHLLPSIVAVIMRVSTVGVIRLARPEDADSLNLVDAAISTCGD